jgi:hypothetical protein
MPTLVEVSRIKLSVVKPSGIEGLGSTWRDAPSYMSERCLIWEIGRPDSERQWDCFVAIDGENLPLVVDTAEGHKRLTVAGKPFALGGLPEWRGRIPA